MGEMIHTESWYLEADERGLQRALKEFRRRPGMESLSDLIRVVTRAGKVQPLWDAVSKVMVEYEVQDIRYRRDGPEDQWDYAGDSAERSYEDDLAWMVNWYLDRPRVYWTGPSTLIFVSPIGDHNKTETRIRIKDSEQAKMIKVLMREYQK